MDTQSKGTIRSSPSLPDSNATQDFDSEVIELIPSSDEEECRDAIPAIGKEDGAACAHDGIKSLVLFEDVDITFIDDRGFIAAIQQLAETAKLPMILTTNSKSSYLLQCFHFLARGVSFIAACLFFCLIC